ncbi:MAG: hypothetical protein JNL33_00680 [Betaproteobacteria bacterium]|nr:hypothetical protein [Betaproteobacteria bacterium]
MTDRRSTHRDGWPPGHDAIARPARLSFAARCPEQPAGGPRRMRYAAFASALVAFQACAADYASLVPSRCIHEMGEWGEQAVHECIRRDLPAAQALEKYPRRAEPLIDRCIQEIGRNGWSAVKECVDKALPSSNPPAAQ